MKIKIILFLVLLTSTIQAQYNNALGVQWAMTGYGLGFKTYIEPNKFLEFEVLGKYEELNKGAYLTAYYGLHNSIRNPKLKMPNLSWFLNFGLHGGYYTDWGKSLDTNTMLGVSTKLGLETVVREQAAIGAYVRPHYSFVHTGHRNEFDYFDFGIYLRFVLN
jgi:hypothetical protein